MKLEIPIHSSRDFTWTNKNGSAEASDFNGDRFAGQIYDDACDYGFAVHSERTGNVMTFVFVRDERDREGDVTHSIYQCIEKADVTITIFND